MERVRGQQVAQNDKILLQTRLSNGMTLELELYDRCRPQFGLETALVRFDPAEAMLTIGIVAGRFWQAYRYLHGLKAHHASGLACCNGNRRY